MGRLVCYAKVKGVDTFAVLTTTPNINLPAFVRTQPGVGKPFWFWDSIPLGKVIGADFTDAPVVTSDIAANAALIASITATPEDVLYYEETEE